MAMEKAEGLSDDQRKKRVIVDLVMKRTHPRHMLGALRPDVEEFEKYLGWVEALGDKDKIRFFYSQLSGHYYWMGEAEKDDLYYNKYFDTLEGEERADIERVYGPHLEHGSVAPAGGYSYLREGNCETAVLIEQRILEGKRDLAFGSTDSSGKVLKQHAFFNACFRLTRFYRMMGQWQKGLALCQEALDLSTEYSRISARIMQARADLGNTYLSMGEYDKVIAECEVALGMSPSGFGISMIATQLGDAYCRTGQLDKGIALLERRKEYAKRVGRGVIVECEYCLPLAEGYHGHLS